MMLYCFTGSDPISQVNLQKTIYNKISLNNYSEYLTDEEQKSLANLELLNGCYMWGAEPGVQNAERWKKVEVGDRIIGYSKKYFICYGAINYKIHNKKLAEAVWGISKKGTTWEYINVFGNLQYIKIPKEMYDEFFKYSEKYKPQGFTNINSKLVEKVIKKYGSIDSAISELCMIPISPYIINDKLNNLDNKDNLINVENYIYKMTEKKFKEYILSLDSSASIDLVKKYVKIRKYNKKIIEDMKKKADGKCQVCGCGCEHGVSIVEAHHIKLFSLSQDNSPKNIIIVCPNHHRLIHKTKAVINVENHTIEYPDGTIEHYRNIL